jgi:sugar phosphate isomerase/epimerase
LPIDTPRPIGVQLYTFRDETRSGAAAFGLDRPVLEALASTGFLGVETVDVPGGDPAAARRVLGELGLAVTSTHTRASPQDLDAFDRAAADLAELGTPRMIVSGRPFATLDELGAFADELNAAAEVAARHGLRLALHNHDGEMRDVGDAGPAYRLLRDRLLPTVDFQLDIFWVVVGGRAPAEVIGELGDRVCSLHVKDGVTLPASAGSPEPFVNVAIGSGVVDAAAAIEAAGAHQSIEWLIVEFDHSAGPPIDAVRASYDFLVGRGLARGRGR